MIRADFHVIKNITEKLMRIEIVRSGIWLIRLPTPICGPFGTHIR